MMANKSNLICSAGSREQLESMINKYFHSENYVIMEDGTVYNRKLCKVLDSYKVVNKRGRWRFELV